MTIPVSSSPSSQLNIDRTSGQSTGFLARIRRCRNSCLLPEVSRKAVLALGAVAGGLITLSMIEPGLIVAVAVPQLMIAGTALAAGAVVMAIRDHRRTQDSESGSDSDSDSEPADQAEPDPDRHYVFEARF